MRSNSVSTIAPNDSVSHFTSHSASLSAHQPATRPSEYPLEILWNLEDCKDNPDVKISHGNISRPPMEQAVHHLDGTMIMSGEWIAIKVTARMIKANLLALPPPRDKQARDRLKTKTYYQSFFSKDWDAVLVKMEQHQPLLALCAAHWKADHILSNTLWVKSSAGADDESNDEPTDANKLKPQGSSESKKRSTSQHDSTSRQAKRRKKDTEQVPRPNNTTNSPNKSTTEPANPVDTSAASGSVATTKTANMSNTDAAVGAAGATDVGIAAVSTTAAVDTTAGTTAAVGKEAVDARAVEMGGTVAVAVSYTPPRILMDSIRSPDTPDGVLMES